MGWLALTGIQLGDSTYRFPYCIILGGVLVIGEIANAIGGVIALAYRSNTSAIPLRRLTRTRPIIPEGSQSPRFGPIQPRPLLCRSRNAPQRITNPGAMDISMINSHISYGNRSVGSNALYSLNR